MVFVTVLTAAAAQISVPLPFTPVPFTFQPMVVLLGAALLGPRLGASSQLLYLAPGIAGLPVFAASPMLPQGGARLLGPTGGYLMAYPLAAFSRAGWPRAVSIAAISPRSSRCSPGSRHLRRRRPVARTVRVGGLGAALRAGVLPVRACRPREGLLPRPPCCPHSGG